MLEDGIFSRSDYLASHRDIAVRFLRASIHGWQDTVQNPNEAARIVKTFDPSGVLSLAHQTYMAREVDKLIEFGPAVVKGLGYMDPTAFARTARISLQYHIIRKAPAGAYDQSFWREALFGGAVHSYEAEASTSTMTGSAYVASCSYCSNDAKVRFVGLRGTLRFNVGVPRAGTYTLTVAYTNRLATRSAFLRINHGPTLHLSFAPTGDWYNVGILQLPVRLNAGPNTLLFSNPTDWTPDFDRITLSS